MGITMKTVKDQEFIKRIGQDLYRLRVALPVLLIYGLTTQLIFGTVCPFAILSGFACPACGMTRAALLFLIGRPLQSFSLHPMPLFWLALILYLGYFRYLRNKHAPFIWPLTVTVCLATFACYFYRMNAGTLPDVPASKILPLVLKNFL